MESNQTISVKRVIVPSFYKAYLNPKDFAAFQPVRVQLEQEMATYLSELAGERSFTLLEHPRVVLAEDPAVPQRSIQVVAELTNAQDGSATQVMSVTTVQQAAPVRKSSALLLLQTPDGPQPIPIESTTLSIGRGFNNDMIVEDSRVSRNHAQLRYRARRFWITDLGSTNGTFVNNAPISEIALRDGDLISLGGLEMTFKEGNG
jgi:hypothetical protein